MSLYTFKIEITDVSKYLRFLVWVGKPLLNSTTVQHKLFVQLCFIFFSKWFKEWWISGWREVSYFYISLFATNFWNTFFFVAFWRGSVKILNRFYCITNICNILIIWLPNPSNICWSATASRLGPNNLAQSYI